MTLRILLTVSLLSVAAGAGAAHGRTYKMVGTEPFWSLAIDGKRMTFDLMGMPKVVQKTPKAFKTRYGRVYWTKRIQVAIVENQPCSDGMSDFVYRDDVKVTVDGKEFIGCGGSRYLPKGGAR